MTQSTENQIAVETHRKWVLDQKNQTKPYAVMYREFEHVLPQLSRSQIVVYLMLKLHSHSIDGYCFIHSLKEMEDRTGYGRYTVKNAIQELADAELMFAEFYGEYKFNVIFQPYNEKMARNIGAI